ncbi:MAG: peptidylprolyl isomerase [Bacteroidetes bacterium]|nr:peptidylprolyl isomerase [Bacteroidota bacterium]MBS1924990.1 peptidylprolyl isomerase [Bacteroidota bacterium]
MQIIQGIRDKGAAIVIIVIALSLIGFILMDAQQGGSRLFAGMSNNVGSVDGEKISVAEFTNQVTQLEDQQEQRSGQRPSGSQIYQVRDQAWNLMVAEKIFYKEANKLGIEFTGKELSALLLSNDPSNPFLQQGLADQTTGKLDLEKAKEALANIKKFTGERRNAVNAQLINPAKLNNIVSKYSSLLSSSAYYPGWMQAKDSAETNNFATISYVSVPFNEVSDSTVKVTDADILAYVAKHKEMFKQEPGRKFSYISFSQLPNKEDTARTLKMVEDLKPLFQADSNAKAFLARNVSAIPFQDDYLPKAKAQSKEIDTLIKYPFGTVYGPYLDGKNYVIAKVLGSKEQPDSVKARHILISLQGKDGKTPMEDSTAKKLADSLLAQVKAGVDFSMLAMQYSADPGSAAKGGDLGFFSYGTMVPEFNEFTFTKPVGSKDVVKTQFGYHIIEVTGQKDFKPAYKVAYLAKEITASDVTINNASLAATKASAEKDSKSLKAYAAKNGLQLIQNPLIVKENDYSAGTLQDARSLIKWVFENKVGSVSEPFGIGEAFVVATVDDIVNEGTQDAATARSGAEAIVRNQKKAAIIKTKLGATPTLESAAAAYGKQIQAAGADSSLTMASQMINGVGIEPKLIGASFNKDYLAKPTPAIEGTSAVYVMKVNQVQSKNSPIPATQASSKLSLMKQQVGNWYESLRKQVTIKDERSKIF